MNDHYASTRPWAAGQSSMLRLRNMTDVDDEVEATGYDAERVVAGLRMEVLP